ncbi:VirK/YbjX family protein [Neisseriaceae bacterium JH1-16]|nr:VirK/YbjX family protein [Neisseriaceae bacterium JH1-16]
MLSTLWEASHCYAEPEHGKSLLHRTKFLLRAMAQWPYSHRWFRYLSEQTELAAVLPRQPQWLHKLQRPYLCLGLSTPAKLQLLRQHYELFLTSLPGKLRSRLLAEQSLLMAMVEGKSGARYRIELSLTHTMDKEGELMLTLQPETTRERLVTLAFSFGVDAHGLDQILLGCLQGPSATGGLERFRDATKDLHGLMPKMLMAKTLCMLARLMGIQRVLAVSNSGHIHNSRLHRYQRINSDYDALWRLLGGTPFGQHFYLVNTAQPERPLSEIASNKRAQYQRRQALERAINNQFVACWHE